MHSFSDIVSFFYGLNRDILENQGIAYDTKFSWNWEKKMQSKAH